MAAKIIDWAALEGDYRSTHVSIAKLAAKYGASPSGIKKRAKASGWTRGQLASVVAEKIQDRIVGAEPGATPTQIAAAVNRAVDTGVEVIQSHRSRGRQFSALLKQQLDLIERYVTDYRTWCGATKATITANKKLVTDWEAAVLKDQRTPKPVLADVPEQPVFTDYLPPEWLGSKEGVGSLLVRLGQSYALVSDAERKAFNLNASALPDDQARGTEEELNLNDIRKRVDAAHNSRHKSNGSVQAGSKPAGDPDGGTTIPDGGESTVH